MQVHAQIEVVAAWSLFEQLHGGAFDPRFDEQHARARVEEFLSATLGEERPRDMIVTLVNDLATTAILERAEDADLVVVGSRGHGGFVGLMLGSVSNQVVHHADCPVVVVRPTKRSVAETAS